MIDERIAILPFAARRLGRSARIVRNVDPAVDVRGASTWSPDGRHVAIGGVGGSGTRLIARMLGQLGWYLGDDLNESVDNLWFRSKSPTKLFEYMASGLAVVAWNLGEVQHVIEDGKNGFLASDSDEMVQSMIQIAQDKELRHSLSTNARQTIEERYSHEVLGEKLADFMEQFVNKK